MYLARRAVSGRSQTLLCECGCGQPTPLATSNRSTRGYYKGQHLRYLPGHQVKSGASSHKWKGGRFVHGSGYVYRYCPDHPQARGGYVLEHRLVMEQTLGRFLDPAERVHHIDHDKSNNAPENLRLYASHGEHMGAEHHADEMIQWNAQHPQHAAKAGRLGALARWSR